MTYNRDALKHGNILIRNLEDSYSLSAMTPNDEQFIDDTVYPQFFSTKHVNTVRQTADGKIVPVTNFADEAAMAAAGLSFGLIDLVSRNQAQPANFYAKAHEVSFWLMNPKVLTPAETWIHHVVDPATGMLHPTLFDIDANPANAIGRIVDFHHVNKNGGATNLVWGSYFSQYYRSFANA